MFFLVKIYLLNFIGLAGIRPITELSGKLFVTTEFSSITEF